MVGGYDGTILDPQVLATTDGRHFRVAARLPVPVRYAATAAVGRPDLGVRRYPGRYLTADYSEPGQIAEFTSSGRLVWRMGGFNQPSLALRQG